MLGLRDRAVPHDHPARHRALPSQAGGATAAVGPCPRLLAVGECRDASGAASMTHWCVASLADGDTHLAEPAPGEHLVIARCDHARFRPLAVLPATPSDQAQTCPTCYSEQPGARQTVRQR